MDGIRPRRFMKRSLLIFATLAAATAIAGDVVAEGLKFQVRGAVRIVARTTRRQRSDGGAARAVYVEGSVDDDVGSHVAGERVELRAEQVFGPASSDVRRGGTEEAKVRFDDASTATTCDGSESPLPRAGDAVIVTTDVTGRFCAQLAVPFERYRVSIATQGTALMDPGVAELLVDTGRRSVSLRFDGVPRRISLDKEEHTFVGAAFIEDDGIAVAAQLLPLTLVVGTGTIVATENTGPSGLATFRVPSSALGAPGLGELRLTFPGDSETASASTAMSIEKRARVTLALEKPIEPTSAPEEGVALDVAVSSRAGVAPTGIVEARLGDKIIGAGPVRDGVARFVVAFALPPRGTPTLSLRFVPDAAWWEAPDALHVQVPVVGTPVWRKLPLALAGVLVALFIVLGRVGRVRTTPRAPKTLKSDRPLRAGVAVLEVARDAQAGYRGRVVDAHERSPVTGARVYVEASDFRGTEIVASDFVTDQGEFKLPAVSLANRPELVVDAPLHASLRKPLPAAGVLEIALVSRKRALLDRLVEWARIRGKPFDSRPEPTPGHVLRAAVPESAPARWAAATEAAAFGPDPVDGRAEAEIDALKPDAAAGPPAMPVGQTREQ